MDRFDGWINPDAVPAERAHAEAAYRLDYLRAKVDEYARSRKEERAAVAAALLVKNLAKREQTASCPSAEDAALETALDNFIHKHSDAVMDCLSGYTWQMQDQAFVIRRGDHIEKNSVVFRHTIAQPQMSSGEMNVHRAAMQRVADMTQMHTVLHISGTDDQGELARLSIKPEPYTFQPKLPSR